MTTRGKHFLTALGLFALLCYLYGFDARAQPAVPGPFWQESDAAKADHDWNGDGHGDIWQYREVRDRETGEVDSRQLLYMDGEAQHWFL